MPLVALAEALHKAAMAKAPTRPQTDASRAASAAYHAKRKEAGMKKVTVWLSPEAQAALERLKETHGSKDAAIDNLLKSPGH